MNCRTYEKIYGLEFANISYQVVKYYNDYMVLVENDKQILVTDINGNIKFEDVLEIRLLDNGCFYIENEDKYIIANADGIIILSSFEPIIVLKNGYCIGEGHEYVFYDISGTKLNEINNFIISDLRENEELFSAYQLFRYKYKIINDKGEFKNCESDREFLIDANFLVGVKDCVFIDAFGNIHTIYNRNGDVLLKKRWPLYLKISFLNNILVLRCKDCYEYYKIKDNKMLKLNYGYIDEIHDNLRKVVQKKNKNHYYGYIDKEGNEVIKPQFSTASNFDHGSALADNKIIDKKGNVLYDLAKYNFDNDASHILKLGKLIFLKFDTYFLLLNTNEKFDFLNITSENSATVGKGGFYNVINETGTYLLNKDYTNEVTDIYDNKLFNAKIDNEDVIINDKESIILKSTEFIKVLRDDFILFQKGKFGVMDLAGNIIIDPLFENITYSNGKLILDGKILKSLPKRNSSYYHVSYNLDVAIADKTITKTFVSEELRYEYIEKLKNELKLIESHYNEQLKQLNLEYDEMRIEIIEEKVYQKKLNNGGKK